MPKIWRFTSIMAESFRMGKFSAMHGATSMYCKDNERRKMFRVIPHHARNNLRITPGTVVVVIYRVLISVRGY